MEINGCHVIPARTSHAVQAAMFVLELPAQISPEILRVLLDQYEKSQTLKNLFPIKSQSQGIAIDLSTSPATTSQVDNLQGISLQRNSSDGQLDLLLNIQGNQIALTFNTYSRWAEVFNQAKEILNNFLGLVCPVPGVNVIGLQYVDEFFVTGDLSKFNSSMIFSSTTSRLPSSALNETNFWHNHSGWFETADNDEKILNNLNISYYPQQDRNAVQLISAHRLMLKTPIADVEILEKTIKETFELLHENNKTLFKEILNKETKESINL